MKLVLFGGADTAVIFWIIKDYLGWISRNLEPNILKNLGEKCEKSTFFPEKHPFFMELERLIDAIRKGIKSTI